MEALACQDILIRAEAGEIKLIWSFMHEDETFLCPFPNRKYAGLRLANLCQVRVGPEEEIYQLACSFELGLCQGNETEVIIKLLQEETRMIISLIKKLET